MSRISYKRIENSLGIKYEIFIGGRGGCNSYIGFFGQ